MLLENLTWPEVKKLKPASKIILFPLGSFEQHGHHLPLMTDTDIVTAVARGVEKKRAAKVLCLPTLWPGHSTHHLFFPGTLSVKQMPYIKLVTELCESIVSMGGRRIFLLNGHGGNDVPIRAALRELKTDLKSVKGLKFVYASYWTLAAQTIRQVRESELGGLGHACEMETSIMLHIHPDRVRMNCARRDGPKHKDACRKSDMQYSRPVYFVNEFHEVTKTGVIGQPELASAAKGRKFLDGIIEDVTAFVDSFDKW
jgi:creatinine amidohydrolase